jgi:hypothetical protein
MALSVCTADEVVLKEGKILTGKITEEDANVLTIDLAAHMVLHVEKSKIKEIHRDVKPESKRPIITMDQLKKESAAPKAGATPMAPPMLIKNAEEGSQTSQKKQDNISFFETLTTKTFVVEGPAAAPSHPSHLKWDIRWEGKFGKEGTIFKWDSVQVFSTTTVSIPYWRGPKNPDAATVNAWNSFFQGVENHNKGHLEIYEEALASIGSGLTALRAGSEADLKAKTTSFVRTIMSRTERKQQGYDRREKTKKK